jgi:hypothetical protein
MARGARQLGSRRCNGRIENVAVVTHPSLSPAEFAAAMDRAGWRAPMELIEGEVVVIPPSGGDASLAQTEVVHRVRAWQAAHDAPGRLLTDVFIRVGDGFLAPDAAWWSAEREPRIGRGAIDVVPDLVVECCRPRPATTTLARSASSTSTQASASCGSSTRATARCSWSTLSVSVACAATTI